MSAGETTDPRLEAAKAAAVAAYPYYGPEGVDYDPSEELMSDREAFVDGYLAALDAPPHSELKHMDSYRAALRIVEDMGSFMGFPDKQREFADKFAREVTIPIAPPATPHCYSCDQGAVDWARAAAQKVLEQIRRFQAEDTDPAHADRWRFVGNVLEMKFIGGETCVITPFDARMPTVHHLVHEGQGLPVGSPVERGAGYIHDETCKDNSHEGDERDWPCIMLARRVLGWEVAP